MLQGARDHCVLGQGNIHEQDARATGRQCGSLAGAGETKNFCQRLALERGKNGIAVGTKYFDLLERNCALSDIHQHDLVDQMPAAISAEHGIGWRDRRREQRRENLRHGRFCERRCGRREHDDACEKPSGEGQ